MTEPSSETESLRGRRALLARYPAVTFLLPLFVFMAITSLEPKPPSSDEANVAQEIDAQDIDAQEIDGGADQDSSPLIAYRYYPCVYTAKILLTLLAVWFVWPGYREFPWKVGPLAVAVGVVGAGVWIGLCQLDIEHTLLQPALERAGLGWIIGSGDRSAFDPFDELSARPILAYVFLTVRFFGLVAIVPVIEEFFLRGFVMRFCVDAEWSKVPFGKVNTAAVVAGTLVPMLMHPGELLAAAVWFSMVTWLMTRTKSIGDCIVAHAITNLLLGVYVVVFGAWWLM